MMALRDTEAIAAGEGFALSRQSIRCEHEGNGTNIQIICPDNSETTPCVYYIHGGGMATMSCYDGNCRAWWKIIAVQGVAVVMGDFRNALARSPLPDGRVERLCGRSKVGSCQCPGA